MRQQQLALGVDLRIPDWFGWWFAGFVDGEGSFILQVTESRGRQLACRLTISLRADDIAVLELIQTMLCAGNITQGWAQPTKDAPNRRPKVTWTVSKLGDLQWIIIPLFNNYPLQAKKKADLDIWAKAVRLSVITRGGLKVCRWPDELWVIACQLEEELKAVRQYSDEPLDEWLGHNFSEEGLGDQD